MYDFSDYPNWDKDKLITRLAEVVTKLADGADQLAFSRSEEVRARRDAWESCEETSASAREQYIKYSTVSHLTSIWEVEAEVTALTEEKWLLVRLLDASG